MPIFKQKLNFVKSAAQMCIQKSVERVLKLGRILNLAESSNGKIEQVRRAIAAKSLAKLIKNIGLHDF